MHLVVQCTKGYIISIIDIILPINSQLSPAYTDVASSRLEIAELAERLYRSRQGFLEQPTGRRLKSIASSL